MKNQSDANISALSDMPVWAFVGSADKIANPESSIQFIDTLKKVNDNAQITVFDGADHASVPELAYSDDEIRHYSMADSSIQVISEIITVLLAITMKMNVPTIPISIENIEKE